MNKKSKVNTRAIFVIGFVVFLLGISFVVLTPFFDSALGFKQLPDIEFNGIELKAEDYKAAKEIFGEDVGFVVCNFESKDCATFINMDDWQQLTQEMQNRQS